MFDGVGMGGGWAAIERDGGGVPGCVFREGMRCVVALGGWRKELGDVI